MERNNLMSKCYPRIKDYCREKHGLEFQVRTFDLFNIDHAINVLELKTIAKVYLSCYITKHFLQIFYAFN